MLLRLMIGTEINFLRCVLRDEIERARERKAWVAENVEVDGRGQQFSSADTLIRLAQLLLNRMAEAARDNFAVGMNANGTLNEVSKEAQDFFEFYQSLPDESDREYIDDV